MSAPVASPVPEASTKLREFPSGFVEVAGTPVVYHPVMDVNRSGWAADVPICLLVPLAVVSKPPFMIRLAACMFVMKQDVRHKATSDCW